MIIQIVIAAVMTSYQVWPESGVVPRVGDKPKDAGIFQIWFRNKKQNKIDPIRGKVRNKPYPSINKLV